MRLACLVVVMTTMTATAAELTTVCQASKGTMREYWSWREIDGRKCWFVGRPGTKAKTQLRWESVVATPVKQRPEASAQTPSQDDLWSTCCWPDLLKLEQEEAEIWRRKFMPTKSQERFHGQ